MRKYRIIIAGGRDFDDYEMLDKRVRAIIYDLPQEEIEIVSGGARGADALGERFADAHDLAMVRFPADWDKHGKAAGHIRNAQMADYGTHLIAFWDEVSRGTKNMIENARKRGLQVRVITYE